MKVSSYISQDTRNQRCMMYEKLYIKYYLAGINILCNSRNYNNNNYDTLSSIHIYIYTYTDMYVYLYIRLCLAILAINLATTAYT